MKDKKNIIYIITIVILILILGLLWYLIINNNNNNNPNNMPNNNMPNNGEVSYSSVSERKENEEITEGEYSSTNKDENAILVTGDIDASLSNISVTKTGDSDGGDNTSFYGTNSGILAKDGANLTIKNATISTNATGANGVFSYGGTATTNNSSSDNTTINISDSVITTSKDNS